MAVCGALEEIIYTIHFDCQLRVKVVDIKFWSIQSFLHLSLMARRDKRSVTLGLVIFGSQR